MTTTGIHGWGVALCRRRLTNTETQSAWNRPDMKGSRAIAGHDEDSLTLGVQAALDAMRDVDPERIDGLIFASTTAPFEEKSSAALIATFLNLKPEARVLDVNSSLRAGTIALSVACDWLAAGSCTRVLVVAADTRLQKPGAPDEILFGHGGVAIILGNTDNCIAELLSRIEYNSTVRDTWRPMSERFLRTADVRFARERAYQQPVKHVLTRIMQCVEWKPEDIGKVVLYSPDIKSGSNVLKQHGFDLKTQYCDLVSPSLGITGTPHTLLMLCAALECASKEDRLIAIGYGDGADAYALQMKINPSRTPFRVTMKQSYEISYNRYLSLHHLHTGSEATHEGFTSEIMAERNKKLWLNLKAQRCTTCGTVVTLPLPSCPHCSDDMHLETYQLQRTGTVFAITHEHYFPTPESPLGMASVNLDGGGRLTLQIADENVPLRIGDRVELVFRRMHDAGNYPNYFWKCRSVESLERI